MSRDDLNERIAGLERALGKALDELAAIRALAEDPGADGHDILAAHERARVDVEEWEDRPRSRTACWVHLDVARAGRVRVDTSWLPVDLTANLGSRLRRRDDGGCEGEVAAIELDRYLGRIFDAFRKRLFGEG